MGDVTRDPCAGCEGVSRRVFVGQSTLIAASALLAACGGPIPGLKNPVDAGTGTGPRSRASTTIRISR